ncbi:MAG TPA: PTS transporter subunit IIC [Anaerovoracaceae bacterium]|nr:PTS transporter subunit IIC [Anaerovoracaceae bacterium]
MSIIKSAVDFVLNLGPSVMMPVIITIFGLCLGQGLKKSFRAGVTIGVGFVAINLVVNLLLGSVGPATTALVENLGFKLDIVDVGWPIGAAISWGTPVAPLLIPIILIMNLILLAVNYTKTMDIDIWNYWHFIFAGSVAYYATDNMFMGILAGCLTAAVTFKLADWTAPALEYHFGLPGVSLPHSETVNFAPIMYLMNKIEDHIPGLNKLNADPESIRKRFGLLGEPMMMGLLLGILMALLGGFDLSGVLTLGIQISAGLTIMPKMVALLMEGLIPFSEGARDFIQKRFPGKDVYIGLDAAIVIGHPANMAVALLMVPIAIFMAMLLPYNRMLPLADLAVLPFTMVWAVAASRGNIIRGLINGIVTMFLVFFLATTLAPLLTTMGHAVGFTFPEGAAQISSIDVGSHIIPWIIIQLMKFDNPAMIALGAGVAVIYGLIWWYVRNDIKKQYAKELAESGK